MKKWKLRLQSKKMAFIAVIKPAIHERLFLWKKSMNEENVRW